MGAKLPDRSTLIKAQFSALDTAAERGTSDEMEATHLRAYAQPTDIDKVRSCGLRRHAQIGGGRRRTRPPHCLAHARPKMPCIRLVYIYIYTGVWDLCPGCCCQLHTAGKLLAACLDPTELA